MIAGALGRGSNVGSSRGAAFKTQITLIDYEGATTGPNPPKIIRISRRGSNF